MNKNQVLKKRLKEIVKGQKQCLRKTRLCVRILCHRLAFFNMPIVLFIGTPIHGNLGDQAIVDAQYKFFDSMQLNINIFEIPRIKYEIGKNWLKHVIAPKNIIVIDGGGNIGTLWPEEDSLIQDIIQRFPHNAILVFPQTAFFADSFLGEQALKATKKVYESHKKLVVFARDQSTYNLFRQKMPLVQCWYTPDIVNYIQDAEKSLQRNDVLFCMRNDKEKVLQDCEWQNLKDTLERHFLKIKETSTLVDGIVIKKTRDAHLKKKWEEFSGARLVVTDRLHGMIFSAITGTPCIAFDNLSHKVRDGYEWLRYLPYIRFCATCEEAVEQLDALLAMPHQHYDVEPLKLYYNKIQEEVINAIG